jgi:hypothetical protein
MRRVLLLIFVSLGINLGLAYTLRGGIDQLICVAFAIGFVAAPAFLLAVIGFVVSKTHLWPDARRFAGQSFVVSLVAGSTFGSLILAEPLLREDISTAKSYCENLVPLLDAYQQQHGRYPENLEAIAPLPPLPNRLEMKKMYLLVNDGAAFEFNFRDPAAFAFGGYRFSSHSRTWIYWD